MFETHTTFPLPSSGNISDDGRDFVATSPPIVTGPVNPTPGAPDSVQQKPLESPPTLNVSGEGTKIS